MESVTLTILACLLMTVDVTSAISYRLAWLAPESTYIGTKAGSTVGALQKAITTIESSILTSDSITYVHADVRHHYVLNAMRFMCCTSLTTLV